ncbi:MAG: hypothetical protein KAI84_04360 [Gammaproteobacteria bacterium]|nr:hypothetical protein [Gammaproteobacteria bacterium]
MKKFFVLICVAVIMFILGNVVQANEVALVFNANDIFNYATEDNTRLNQQGKARRIHECPTGRYYLTYNDSAREDDADAYQDIQSIANILGWEAFAGHQGACHLQLWLKGGSNALNWGEYVVVNNGFTGSSVNGETEWTVDHSSGSVHFNTVLGDCNAGHCNAISSYHPAEYLWSVAGDFTASGQGLVIGQQYTIWFDAILNNWHYVDDYGNDTWGGYLQPHVEGTIVATAFPAAIVDQIDKIVDCETTAKNHGKFVSCVAHLTNDWMEEGLITGEEKGAIMSWAAKQK